MQLPDLDAWGRRCDDLNRNMVALTDALVQREDHTQPRQTQRVPRHQTYAFTSATSGWTQVIPPNPNVLAITWLLVAATDTVSVTLGHGYDASTASPFPSVDSAAPGAIPLATAGSSFDIACPWPSCLFELSPGEGFFLKLSGNVQIQGYTSFYILDREQSAS